MSPARRSLSASWPVLAAALFAAIPASAADPFRDQRLKMVEEYIVQEGVGNPRVLEAMRSVPRHEFVPLSLRSKAYLDGAWPIGHKQTISPPFIVAYMTETIDPQPEDRVLEIGTGSGYQAAVLSGLCKEVYTIEIVEPLGKTAAARLRKLGYDNVHVKVGDGYQGWPEHAPFDKIIVTCSPEDVPKPLIEQLKEGGRMIIPLGERYQQVFHLFEKKNGELVQQKLIPTLFVPMTGISEEQREILPDPARPEIVNGGFEADESGDGRPDHWHYQRQTRLASDGAPEGSRYVLFENTERGRAAQMLQGTAIDGRSIGRLRVSCLVKHDQTAAGNERYELPCLMIHFYDVNRRSAGDAAVGPWLGTSDWQPVASELRVPPGAREMIIRIGLNGGTGTLCIDDVRLEPLPR